MGLHEIERKEDLTKDALSEKFIQEHLKQH